MRLTDADAFKRRMYTDKGFQIDEYGNIQTNVNALNIALERSAIEAEPVRYGKWIDIDEQTYTWKIRCSCCGHERSMLSTQGKYPNYCEACGARMDTK